MFVNECVGGSDYVPVYTLVGCWSVTLSILCGC